MKEPIKVFLRLRPLNEGEEKEGGEKSVKAIGQKKITVDRAQGDSLEAEFDSVFVESSTQDEVYEESCQHLPQQLLDGFNCSVIAYGATGTGKTSTLLGISSKINENNRGGKESDKESGVLSRLARGIFDAIESADSGIEFTIRCSVVEVYLNRMRDLLVESNLVALRNSKLEGCSRLSCFGANDMINIVKRAQGVRTFSAADSNRNSSRSSLFVQVEVEQYQQVNQKCTSSRLMICDLVGSELSSISDNGEETSEPVLISKSLEFLQRHVRDAYDGILPKMSDSAPVVAEVLSTCLGGNSYTSLLLTASPSIRTARQTLNTINFGQDCRKICSFPSPNVHEQWQDCNLRIREAEEKNVRLGELSKALAGECHRLHTKAGAHMNPGLETAVEEILDGVAHHRELEFMIETKQEHQIRTEQMKLRSESRRAVEARAEAEKKYREIIAELPILRTQNDAFRQEVKQLRDELTQTKNEHAVLQQRHVEAEHNLMTSQFRENEAVVFLRQLRRFYYRLLRKMAAEGSGSVDHIINNIPGAPDLTQLVDFDRRMVESGLLEEEEIGNDVSGESEPSKASLGRSSAAAEEMKNEAKKAPFTGDTESPPVEISEKPPRPNTITKRGESPHVTEARQKLYSTPSGRYVAMREKFLEAELFQLAEKASQLQSLVDEERAKVEALTEKTGASAALERLKAAKETKTLRQQLEKKEKDLKAVVLKMNELHVTGKALAAESINKNDHLAHLEEAVVSLQSKNSILASDKEKWEKQFLEENASLREQLTDLSTPVWHLDEGSQVDIPLKCRIVIPFTAEKDIPVKTERRESGGGEGEWIVDPRSIVYQDAETQTEQEMVDAEVQTEPTLLDLETVDAEVQTDPIAFTPDIESANMETQTEPVSISLGHETAEAEVQTDPAPLGQLIGDTETVVNDDGTCILCGNVAEPSAPASALETNVDDFLFMMESPLTEKVSVQASSSERETISMPTTFLKKEKPKLESGSANNDTKSVDTSDHLGKQIDIGPAEDVTKNAEPDLDPAASSSTENIPAGNTIEEEGAKPVKLSSFMQKLQNQAKKKVADDDGQSVPEFLRKFRKIGTRNMGENVIETSGEAPAAQPTKASAAWTPRKKKSDDDSSDSSDDGFPNSFTKGAGRTQNYSNQANDDSESSEEEVKTLAVQNDGMQLNQGASGGSDSSDYVDEAKPTVPAPVAAPTPSWGKKDDSDSDDDSSDDEKQINKPTPPTNGAFGGRSNSRESDDSSDSSDGEKKVTNKTTPPGPKQVFGKNDDSDSDDSSDSSDDEKKKPATPLVSRLTLARKDSDDSSDSSSDDEPQKETPALAPPPAPAAALKKPSSGSDDSDSSSDEETPKKSFTPPSPKQPSDDEPSESSTIDSEAESAKLAPTPAVVSKKPTSDSDSDSDSSDDEATPKPPAPPLDRKKLAEDSDSSESSSVDSDEEPPKKTAPPPPQPKKISDDSDDDASDSSDDEKPAVQKASFAPSKDDDPSESSTAESDDEPKNIVAIPPPKKASSDSDDSESSSDEDAPPPKPPAPVAQKEDYSSNDDSSSVDSDDEPKKVAAVPAKAAPTPSFARKDSSDSSDSDSSDDDAPKKTDAFDAFGSDPFAVGGKAPDFSAMRSVPDFGDDVTSGVTKTEEISKGKKGKDDGGKKGKAKFIMKGGKLVKVDAGDDPKSPEQKPAGKPKFVVRGGKLVKDKSALELLAESNKKGKQSSLDDSRTSDFDVVQSDKRRGSLDGSSSDWGKTPVKSSPRRTKSNFVIKNGKLVKEGAEATPKKPPGKAASFKIVGGKLVKDGEDGNGKGKKAGKKGSKKGKKGDKGSADKGDGKKKKKKKFGMF